MSQPFRPDPADDLSGRVLDDHEPLLARGCPEEVDWRRLADLQLVHALLEQIHGQQAVANDRRVRRVLEAIAAETQQPEAEVRSVPRNRTPQSARPGWRWFSLATAALVLVSAVLFWQQSGQQQARAAVELAYRQALREVDRQYDVRIMRRGGEPQDREEVRATLYVRGGDRVALRHPAPLGGDLWLGTNGNQSWLALPRVPVLVNDRPILAQHWLAQGEVAMPILKLSTMLSRMQDRYRLTSLPPESLEDRPDLRWLRVRGERKDGSWPWPAQVDLWINPETGVAEQVVLDWSDDARPLGPDQITFRHRPIEPLPADWYDPDTQRQLSEGL